MYLSEWTHATTFPSIQVGKANLQPLSSPTKHSPEALQKHHLLEIIHWINITYNYTPVVPTSGWTFCSRYIILQMKLKVFWNQVVIINIEVISYFPIFWMTWHIQQVIGKYRYKGNLLSQMENTLNVHFIINILIYTVLFRNGLDRYCI